MDTVGTIHVIEADTGRLDLALSLEAQSMPKLRIYPDTSILCHLFHNDAPQRKADTEKFFENAVVPKAYETFISSVVIDELARTQNPELRQQFLDAVSRCQLVSGTCQ